MNPWFASEPKIRRETTSLNLLAVVTRLKADGVCFANVGPRYGPFPVWPGGTLVAECVTCDGLGTVDVPPCYIYPDGLPGDEDCDDCAGEGVLRARAIFKTWLPALAYRPSSPVNEYIWFTPERCRLMPAGDDIQVVGEPLNVADWVAVLLHAE